MSDKKLSRSDLRKLREVEQQQQEKEKSLLNKEYEKREGQIDNFYRKQHKKQDKKTIKKSRVTEKQKMDRRGYYLNIAIFVVSLLIILLFVLIWWG